MVEGGSESLQFVDEAALAEPGVKEGQQKFVRDENGVKWLYQWSGATQTWEKIGEITGTDNSGANLGKRMFEGKEWDYLFDIDINGKMVRLPFNRGDDPWMAAQQWMWKNDIDQGFLDQVANHIIQNTPGNVDGRAAVDVEERHRSGIPRPGGQPHHPEHAGQRGWPRSSGCGRTTSIRDSSTRWPTTSSRTRRATWMAAQQWMWKNDIDQGFLDQV